MDLYAENILDHFRHPRGKGDPVPEGDTVTHVERNPSCGDDISVSLKPNKDAVMLSWDGHGCAISQAGMSLLFEAFDGKPLQCIEHATPATVYDLLGVPIGPSRIKCALMGLLAVKNALRVSRGEPPMSWSELLENS